MTLRTFFRVFIISAILLIFSFYFYSPEEIGPIIDDSNSLPPKPDYNTSIPLNGMQYTDKQPASGLGSFIGRTEKEFIDSFGEPDRREPSAYGYEWWIYNEDLDTYLQAGVQDGMVVTVYAAGKNVNVAPFKMGQSIENIHRSTVLETEFVVNIQDNTYRFELSEEDLNIRPLIQLGDIFAQLSIDKFTGSLFSVRFLDKQTLISHRPYELVYRGDLIEPEKPEESQWLPIERGSEQQIFDITNNARVALGLPPLRWDENVASVAYEHSKDMSENDYFSHESPDFGDLAARLEKGKIDFRTAGENIAADYVDGPAAVEGWLNSEAHREALLDEDYTHIGIGVYKKKYTQNFITPVN
ncbi:CAP domain-containing protein [Siminovitchia sediminis]|uniref:CAP domain-containing protein n=1 Tax=Siminovitchia sediminis TaxID=1274353 RepID=A0ABW4KC64_9BACI